MKMAVMAGAVVLIALLFIAYSRVDNRITAEDRTYISKILTEGGVRLTDRRQTYDDEIVSVQTIQRVVQDVIAKGECIPQYRSREPKDVYEARCGESYDRSRVIEKTLRSVGFKTRHILILSAKEMRSGMTLFFLTDVFSHSVTEVLTQRGWLVIDPDDRWLSLNGRGDPVSLKQIQAGAGKGLISWSSDDARNMPWVYREPFTFLYGLYSRHGKFYPPYNFIPDINWTEFLYNAIPAAWHGILS